MFPRQKSGCVCSVKSFSVAYATLSSAAMGYVRLKIREVAIARGWSLRELSDRSGVNYNTIKSYVNREVLNTVDLSAIYKIAQAFDVSIEELIEVLEE